MGPGRALALQRLSQPGFQILVWQAAVVGYLRSIALAWGSGTVWDRVLSGIQTTDYKHQAAIHGVVTGPGNPPPLPRLL